MGSCGGTNAATMVQRVKLLPGPDPMSITEDSWVIAEETIQEMVNLIHPTLDAEEKRKDVTEHLQKLMRYYLGCEVFPYGSVPLKTYLPDGDIDLTALSGHYSEEALAHCVLAVLQQEEAREHAEYYVKDTQFIDAEVKLVKCLVQDMEIDITFNQLGGLSSLCFLEQVDRLVGKNHLFKRSIILAKAWCYYESRILGAHHGLIATYALEIMVLYIVHMFHSSLNGPLAVLYRFLDYYSKFDWDTLCISLNGPVRKATLPNIVAVNMPDNGGNNVLLSEDFLKNCMEMFSVAPKDTEVNPRAFQQKFLNIIDPLKGNNNLGRSVHKANYNRIRSAFKYGARKLGCILSSPSDEVGNKIKKFFASTLKMHGGGQLTSSSPNFNDGGAWDDILFNLSQGDWNNDSEEMVYKGSVPRSVSENCYILDGVNNMSVPQSWAGHGNCGTGSLGLSDCMDEKVGSENRDNPNPLSVTGTDYSEGVGSTLSSPKTSILGSFSLDLRETDDVESLYPLADLTGDYDSHIRSFLYGQCCRGVVLPPPTPPVSYYPSSPSWYQMNVNPMLVSPNVQLSSYPQSSLAQGTCSYSLNASYAYPQVPNGWDRNVASGTYTQFNRYSGNNMNGWAPALTHTTKSTPEVSGVKSTAVYNGNKKYPQNISGVRSTGQSRGEFATSGQSLHRVEDSRAKGMSKSPGKIEFGTVGELPNGVLGVASVSPKIPCSKLALGENEGTSEKLFLLKSEEEFPPLPL